MPSDPPRLGRIRRYNLSCEGAYTFKIHHATPLLLIGQISCTLAERAFTHDDFRTYRKG